jgi:hypothetical protein
MKIVGMQLEITSHRLLFKSNTHHALQIKGETIKDVSISVNIPSYRKKDSSARHTTSKCIHSMAKSN